MKSTTNVPATLEMKHLKFKSKTNALARIHIKPFHTKPEIKVPGMPDINKNYVTETLQI